MRSVRFGRLRLIAAGTLAAAAALLTAATAVAAVAAPRPDAAPEDGAARDTPPVVADYFASGYAPSPILPSATFDAAAGTVTLPLHRGRMRDGRPVWYVLTDVSDRGAATQFRLNHTPKLANAPAEATRTATRAAGGELVFDGGWVDFAPERTVTPGPAPTFFPPAVATAGSVGDAGYSPLVRVGNAVFNATTVANGVEAGEIEFPDGGVDYRKVIDRATAISPARGTVTFRASTGTSSGRPVVFLSLDSNSQLVSALEATTVAPALNYLPVGKNDDPGSAVAANYIIANGPTGADNPQRQGLNSALGDQGAQVLDIFDGAPGVRGGDAYSPMWDLHVAAWTDRAIETGARSRLDSELAVLHMARRGWLTAPAGGAVGPSGLISNCPLIVHY